MVYFLRRGAEALSCETRLHPSAPGFQLVVSENAREEIEDYDDLPAMLAREHELLQTWRAQGWREMKGHEHRHLLPAIALRQR
jgi:hypothetical protein